MDQLGLNLRRMKKAYIEHCRTNGLIQPDVWDRKYNNSALAKLIPPGTDMVGEVLFQFYRQAAITLISKVGEDYASKTSHN